jgi:hypothetical protein
VYGTYADSVPYWEELVIAMAFDDPLMLVGGDLNFTLSYREVWGKCPKVDSQSYFFIYFIANHKLVDMNHVKLVPTWRNLRTQKEVVSKRLDIFISSEAFLSLVILIKSSVGEGGTSNHHPIILKVFPESDPTPNPLKFNPVWMEEEDI